MKRGILLSAIMAGMVSSPVFSGAAGLSEASKLLFRDWVASVSVGSAWAKPGQTQTFLLSPGVEKSFVADRRNHPLFDGDIFVGIRQLVNERIEAQVGLDLGYSAIAELQGSVWDDGDSAFNNHDYSYQIRHGLIAAKGKLLLKQYQTVLPWISGAAGVGFNRARHYENYPTISEATADENFTSKTKESFSYTLGAGVQTPLMEHWQAGIGYEFSDWGKSQLGLAPGQTMNTGLKLAHTYTNAVLLNLTYLA